MPLPTEEEFYEDYKDDADGLEEMLSDIGTLEIIDEMIREEYSRNYFKKICFDKDRQHFHLVGYCEIYNLRLQYDPSVSVTYEEDPSGKYFEPKFKKEWMRANEVMSILDISRPTLCHYVKKGLIKIDSNYTGKQYRYNAESVYQLLKK